MPTSIHRKLQKLLTIAAKTPRPLDRQTYVALGLTRSQAKQHEGRIG